MESIWVAIVVFGCAAAVLLSVVVTGPPSHPILFAVLFVAAMAGLGLSVMALQVAEYREGKLPSRASGHMRDRDTTKPPPSAPPRVQFGRRAAAPAAVRNLYIAEGGGSISENSMVPLAVRPPVALFGRGAAVGWRLYALDGQQSIQGAPEPEDYVMLHHHRSDCPTLDRSTRPGRFQRGTSPSSHMPPARKQEGAVLAKAHQRKQP